MIRRGLATRYDRIADSGRNQPLRVVVELPDGEEVEVMLKPSGRQELGIEGVTNEAVAACLAADVGVPVTEPILVDLSPAWIASIPRPDVKAVLQKSASVAFGSTIAGSQWKLWSRSDRLPTALRQTALAIFAFDAFVENDDRTESNSNLLTNGRELRAIDHESAFRIRLKRWPTPEPWSIGYLNRFVAPSGHALAGELRGRELDFEPVRAGWAGLTDRRLSEYVAMLPPEWNEARPYVADALAHVRAVRDRIDDCITELRRALT